MARKEEDLKNKIQKSLEHHFRPEFLNRLDEIIIFNGLDPAALKEIAKIQLSKLTARIKSRNISISITHSAEDALAKEGYDPHYGARPLRRIIQSKILNPLAESIISGKIKEGDGVIVDWKNNAYIIELKKSRVLHKLKKLKVAAA